MSRLDDVSRDGCVSIRRPEQLCQAGWGWSGGSREGSVVVFVTFCGLLLIVFVGGCTYDVFWHGCFPIRRLEQLCQAGCGEATGGGNGFALVSYTLRIVAIFCGRMHMFVALL
jgi:hypothetical protein